MSFQKPGMDEARLADRGGVFEQFFRTVQRTRNVLTDILPAQMFFKVRSRIIWPGRSGAPHKIRPRPEE